MFFRVELVQMNLTSLRHDPVCATSLLVVNTIVVGKTLILYLPNEIKQVLFSSYRKVVFGGGAFPASFDVLNSKVWFIKG